MMDQNSDGSSQSSKNGGAFQPWMSAFGGGMWPAFPFNPMGGAPSFMTPPSVQTPKNRSTNKGGKRKPWEDDEDDDDVEEVEDADFKPKRKYTPRTTRGKGAQKSANRGRAAQHATCAGETGKTAAEQLMLRRVKSLPDQFHLRCEVTFDVKEECPACGVYKGSVILKPCGHASFCFRCIDKFQEKCVKNGRLFMCPVNECNDFVTGWLRMYNVSA